MVGKIKNKKTLRIVIKKEKITRISLKNCINKSTKCTACCMGSCTTQKENATEKKNSCQPMAYEPKKVMIMRLTIKEINIEMNYFI